MLDLGREIRGGIANARTTLYTISARNTKYEVEVASGITKSHGTRGRETRILHRKVVPSVSRGEVAHVRPLVLSGK